MRFYHIAVRLLRLVCLSWLIIVPPSLSFAADNKIDDTTTSAIGAYVPVQKLGKSGLPLPRFASLKANRVNLRIGPGREHAISMRYLKAGLPVEIINEWSNWRQIRDWEGTEGWVHGSLLSGKRAVIVAPWSLGTGKLLEMFAKPDEQSRLVAQLEAGASAQIKQCADNWCQLEVAKREGWIEQDRLWGVYGGEPIKD